MKHVVRTKSICNRMRSFSFINKFIIIVPLTLSVQGQPGLEGPIGEPGFPGCNGSKVSSFSCCCFSPLNFFDWLQLISVFLVCLFVLGTV